MTFGQKLKTIRELLGYTQQELADSIEATQAAINAIESGKNKKASFDIFRKLVVVHHVNPYYFLFDSTNEPAILKREGSGTKQLLQKIAKYEKLVDQLALVKKGK